MKALRIKAFQETACYTKPFANKVTETYPLPPYSTVKGMIHALLNADRLVPFSLSVQGDYESMIIDYRKTYFVKRKEFNMPIILDGLAIEVPEFTNMTSMPLYTHMLYNVTLVFHLKAEEEILRKIYDAFRHMPNHLSLGRQEDLLRIDEVKITGVEELDLMEGKELTHSMYIPSKLIQEDERRRGIPYLLNWTYEVKKGLREWSRIPVSYVSKKERIDDDFLLGPAFIDDEGYVIAWND
ncbi:MAG: type I-B CRISPR-associated protein Cas5 [Caldibacillus debilis]|uniref:Type I-B CRISPR-associated protein Cas5 n=1 Tax=Caldibacillus debilis TaxID=301148 RepID=A0A150M5G9_9BACI|nr:type I-B CRISPR-associated protein Cas5b [Caldibacillus debilis]KYD19349.1 hypothetical protein B4135_2080 [Caldibacillus debilis]REJ27602.1 MAG: type I-B CRISPR-associated protein Cas5 [Caldibacillus debilis]